MRPLTILIALLAALAAAAARAEPAEAVFARLREAVVQVRVIDRASHDRAAIGSGFQVSADGVLATNFHVVAEAAAEPARYRLEYLDAAGRTGVLELLDVDVVHDLALLRIPAPLPAVVPLATRALVQGERLLSIGNPLDLAMTIIEGTYNGYVDGARYRRILFSASLNPGMSGGPALNGAGELVGVNVARGGEQISFLVPADYLSALLGLGADAQRAALPLEDRIGEALLADQDAYFGELLDADWASQAFEGFRVPVDISPTMRCWGGSGDQDEELFEHAYRECGSEDTVYVEPSLETGGLRYAFHAFRSKGLNSVRFYALMAAHYQHGAWSGAGEERQVGNFRCREDFLRGSGLDWRVSFCARRYARFPGLYDVSVAMASAGFEGHGLVANLGINGISEPRARLFLRRFVESIAWQP